MATRSSLNDVESLDSFGQLWNFNLVFNTLPSGITTDIKEFTFRCRSSALPGRTAESMLIELGAVSIQRPGKITVNHDFQVTFLDSQNWRIRQALLEWQDIIYSWNTNEGNSSDVYMVDATLYIFGDGSTDIAREVVLRNVWPREVQEVTFDSSQNGPGELNVTLSYDYML